MVQKRKLGILQFTSLAGMDTNSVLLLYLIAAADPQDPVSRCGTGPRSSNLLYCKRYSGAWLEYLAIDVGGAAASRATIDAMSCYT